MRMSRRGFLRYIGAGSLATVFTLSGLVRLARAQRTGVERLLDLVARTPDDVINGLYAAVNNEALEDKGRRLALLGENLRDELTTLAGDEQLAEALGQFAVVAVDPHEEDEADGFKISPDKGKEGSLSIAAIGFFSENMGFLVREIL